MKNKTEESEVLDNMITDTFEETLGKTNDAFLSEVYTRAYLKTIFVTRDLSEDERIKECQLTGGQETIMDKKFNRMLDNKQLRAKYEIK